MRRSAGPRAVSEHVLVVSSAGGVLLDVLALTGGCQQERRFVAVAAADTDDLLRAYDVRNRPERSLSAPFGLVAELAVAVVDLVRRRPVALVSAGTAVAVPWFLAAWILRVPTVWVETLNMVGQDGRASRLCTRVADVVAVQREGRVRAHRRSVLVGELY